MPRFKVNWHHALTADYLTRFAKGEITRLMIFMPPRHTKSELGSRRLPGFLFGHDPDEEIMACSYSDEMSSLMNRDCQRVIDTPEYRELFPDVTLSGENVTQESETKYLRNNHIFEVVGWRGKYHSVGVGGAATGKGATTLLIDDPIKNQQEADSKLMRDRTHDWYTSTIHSRLVNRPGKPAKILLMMTRWHQDDLAGRLLSVARADPKADQWTVLNLPAIKENDINEADIRQIGEALWPYQNDLDSLEKVKAGSIRVWNALYQGRPSPPTGLIIQRNWFKFYKAIPSDMEIQIMSADLTFKEGINSDFVAIGVWGRVGANKYLLDQVRGKMSFTGTLQAFESLAAKWPNATLKLVEEAANGAALIDTMRAKISGLVGVKPRTSKIARAEAVSPQFEAGNVYLPDPSIAPWIHDYIEEWMEFPQGAHDDQVDQSTQALLRLEDSKSLDWAPPSQQGLTQVSKWRK